MNTFPSSSFRGSVRGFFVLLGTALFAGSALTQAQVYVGLGFDDQVAKFNLSNGTTVSSNLVGPLTGHPISLLLSGNTLFVPNSISNTVGKYDAVTGQALAGSISGFANPRGLAISGNTLYVAGGGGVSTYNATNGQLITAGLVAAANLSGPQGIAVAGGFIFVANFAAGTIGKFDAATGATINTSFITGLNSPVGLAILGTNLYVSNNLSTSSRIGRYDIGTGTGASSFITSASGVSAPWGIAIAGADLYVVNTGFGRVSSYNASSGATGNLSVVTGLSVPQGLAVQAIPEPASLALLGFGAATLLGWRRRKGGSPA